MMAFSVQAFMDYEIPVTQQSITRKDAIFYALSVGYGRDPLDASHLRRVYEREIIVTPTLANVVAHPGPWMKNTGVDWSRLVHSEHRLEVHRPIALDTALFSRSRSLCVVDRGVGKGMFATFERSIFTSNDALPLATITQTNAARGDGGCGCAGEAPESLPPVPSRASDFILSIDVPIDAALLFRLNGDSNALHVDPEEARRAGFARPILHGLCLFGYAGYACAFTGTSDVSAEIQSIAARFSAPVYPGDVLEFQIWRNGRDVRFRATVPKRSSTVLDHGKARLA